jgi:hypothetical protein
MKEQSSVNAEIKEMIEYLVDISPYTKEELADYTLEQLENLANQYFTP